MIQHEFTCHSPTDLNQAYAWAERMKDSIYLAGGTDLVPLMKYGVKKPENLIRLDHLPELKIIEKRKGGLYVGAMLTLWEIQRHPLIKAEFPSLRLACQKVASPQIQSQGTLGGNLLQDRRCIYYNQSEEWRSSISLCYKTGGTMCHQAPASDYCKALYYSDVAPVLWSLGARAVVFDGDEKWMPVEELIQEHVERNGLVKREKRILKGFWIPQPPERALMKFEKLSLRGSLVFPVMNIAFQLSPSLEGIQGSLVVGGTAPAPILLEKTVKRMELSKAFTPEERKKTGELALEELLEKSQLVRESGISLKVKRNTLKHVSTVVEQLMETEVWS